MARTLIGTLILSMRQNVTAEAAKVNQALAGIDNSVKRMSSAGWGSSFQRQLDRFVIPPERLKAIQTSWGKLQTTLSGVPAKDSAKAVGDWKNGVLSHLTALETGIGRNVTQARKLKTLLGQIGKMGLVAAGGYTLFYLGGSMLRGGITSGSERDRANFRLDMASIPAAEQANVVAMAQMLSAKYRGTSATDIMNSYLSARSAMGDEARTMAIMEPVTKLRTVLQSIRGVNVAQTITDNIMKSADVLGLNSDGQVGIDNVTKLLDGITKAAQIEGLDFDPGAILQFARGTKVAGLGFSPEFLSAIAPAVIQDMGAPQAGKALAMEFKSFVLGDASQAGKLYKARQRELGIRDDTGLVGADLMTTNPYEWVQKVLQPALLAKGYDPTDQTSMTQVIGSLSRNTNATGVLTRMLLQQPQIDKNVRMYQAAMGIDAAGAASERDPFIAGAGVSAAFANLAGALSQHVHVIVPALNAISDGVNRFSGVLADNPLLAQIVAGGAAVGGAVAIGSLIAGIFSLGTAGPALNAAAVSLEAAALSLGGAGGAGAAGVAGAAAGGTGIAALASAAAITAAPGALSLVAMGGPYSASEFDQEVENQRKTREQLQGALDWVGQMFSNMGFKYEEVGPQDGAYNMHMPQYGKGSSPSPIEDVQTSIDKAAADAKAKLAAVSDMVVKPQVDTSGITSATAAVNDLLLALGNLNALAVSRASSVSSQLSRANADYGVAP